MHSFFYDHTAAETVVDGDPGDVVRAGGGGGSGADQYCVIPPDPQTDLPNDEEFMIADFQELLTGVRASTPLPPWPRPGPGPVEPLPRAVRSMLTSTSRVLGSKRSRKGQAKKVVCVPAPAADQESNKGNVVVPSDLWAWRKYGQKPIKGSPYPRGYYRCSSSKGCLARKQVERSPSDPTMLLITYSTAEHNHALPTRRNSLAGSSRSAHAPPENSNMIPQSSGSTNHHAEAPPAASLALVDQMVVEEEITKCEFEHEIFGNSYQPSQLVPESESFDFFAEVLGGGGGGGGGLDNIPDPVQSLIFSSRDQEDRYLQLEGETKALDPLSLFDWDIGN